MLWQQRQGSSLFLRSVLLFKCVCGCHFVFVFNYQLSIMVSGIKWLTGSRKWHPSCFLLYSRFYLQRSEIFPSVISRTQRSKHTMQSQVFLPACLLLLWTLTGRPLSWFLFLMTRKQNEDNLSSNILYYLGFKTKKTFTYVNCSKFCAK